MKKIQIQTVLLYKDSLLFLFSFGLNSITSDLLLLKCTYSFVLVVEAKSSLLDKFTSVCDSSKFILFWSSVLFNFEYSFELFNLFIHIFFTIGIPMTIKHKNKS